MSSTDISVEVYRTLEELDSYQRSLEDLFDIRIGLESLREKLATESLTEQGKVFVNHGYKAHVQRLDISTEGLDVSQDNEAFVVASQESIGKVVKRVWEAIKKAWQKFKDGLKKLIKWFADKGKKLLGKSDDVLKRVKKNKKLSVDPKLEAQIKAVAEWTSDFQTLLDKDFSDYVKGHQEARDLIDRVAKGDETDFDSLPGKVKGVSGLVKKTEERIDKVRDAQPSLDVETKSEKMVELGSLEKDIEKIVEALAVTKTFFEKVDEEHEKDDKAFDAFNKWLQSKDAENVDTELMKVAFDGQVGKFSQLASSGTRLITGVLSNLDKLLEAKEINLASGVTDGNSATESMKKFVKSKDLLQVRTALQMELNVRRLFTKDLYATMAWVEKQRPEVFVEYEEKAFARAIDTDKKNWTAKYYDGQTVYLKTNFSKKRYSHLISVREFLYDKLWS